MAEAVLTNANLYGIGLPQEYGGPIEHVYREHNFAAQPDDASHSSHVPLASHSRSWLSVASGVSLLATVTGTMVCESASRSDRC